VSWRFERLPTTTGPMDATIDHWCIVVALLLGENNKGATAARTVGSKKRIVAHKRRTFNTADFFAFLGEDRLAFSPSYRAGWEKRVHQNGSIRGWRWF
jgi:hypothetical protein